MSGFPSLAQHAVRSLVRLHGGGLQASLRRFHTLQDPHTGALSQLELDGMHSAGATGLALRATRVQGLLKKGITLTIAGTDYTAQATAKASSNALSVGISPVLAADAIDGTLVDVGAYVDYVFDVAAGGYQEEDTSEQFQLTDRKLYVAAAAHGETWSEDDHCVLSGVTWNVVSVRPYQPDDSTQVGWVLQLRRGGS